MNVTVTGASRPKGQIVHGAGIFVDDVPKPGSGSRRSVAESGSVAPPVLGMRSPAQQCRRRQFASGGIKDAHERGFNLRARLRICSLV